jgi:hypothetical protein
MQTDTTTVVQTVACDLGNCGSCRGQVLTLTLGLDAPIQPCGHGCHAPDPIEDQELEVLLDIEADRALENEWIGAWS